LTFSFAQRHPNAQCNQCQRYDRQGSFRPKECAFMLEDMEICTAGLKPSKRFSPADSSLTCHIASFHQCLLKNPHLRCLLLGILPQREKQTVYAMNCCVLSHLLTSVAMYPSGSSCMPTKSLRWPGGNVDEGFLRRNNGHGSQNGLNRT